MRDNFTQGTIIANIRSLKYPSIKCKGIVISARCDFAQNKIKYFHCLSAMELEQWIYEVLFWNIVEEVKKGVLKNLRTCAKELALDFVTLMEFGVDKSRIVFEKNLQGKRLKQVLQWCDEWKYYEEMECGKVSIVEKQEFFKEKVPKKICMDKLRSLYNGAFPKYCFIPQNAYSDEKSVTKGIVIDLQDIYQYDMNYKVQILDNQIDYQLVKDEELRTKINELFFFEKEDFVIVEGIIKSPWIEYLLQHFSHSFGRIGVDNATPEEMEDFFSDFFRRINDKIFFI